MNAPTLKSMVLLSAGIAAGWLAYAALPSATPAPAATDSATTAQPPPGALQRQDIQLARLSRSVERAHADLRALRAGAHSEAEPGDADPLATNEPEAPEPPPTPEEDRALVASAWESQDRDPAWSPDAERALEDALANLVPDGRLEASCGSTMCRLQVESDSQLDAYETANALPNRLPWDGEGAMHLEQRDDGTMRTTVYLAREGHELSGG